MAAVRMHSPLDSAIEARLRQKASQTGASLALSVCVVKEKTETDGEKI
jgi:hypothetical protein